MGFLSNILGSRGHRIAELIAEYRPKELTGAVVPFVALKQAAHAGNSLFIRVTPEAKFS